MNKAIEDLSYCDAFERTLEALFAEAPEPLRNEFRHANALKDLQARNKLSEFAVYAPAKLLARYRYEIWDNEELSESAKRHIGKGRKGFIQWRKVYLKPHWMDTFVFCHQDFETGKNELGVIVIPTLLNIWLSENL